MELWDEVAGGTARAPRSDVQVALLYRQVGDLEWRGGRTENISRSGIVFRSKSPLEPDTTVEMGLVLQTGSHRALRPQMLMCTGRIVRTITLADTLHRVVAQINEYRFVEKPYAEPGQRSQS